MLEIPSQLFFSHTNEVHQLLLSSFKNQLQPHVLFSGRPHCHPCIAVTESWLQGHNISVPPIQQLLCFILFWFCVSVFCLSDKICLVMLLEPESSWFYLFIKSIPKWSHDEIWSKVKSPNKGSSLAVLDRNKQIWESQTRSHKVTQTVTYSKQG